MDTPEKVMYGFAKAQSFEWKFVALACSLEVREYHVFLAVGYLRAAAGAHLEFIGESAK